MISIYVFIWLSLILCVPKCMLLLLLLLYSEGHLKVCLTTIFKVNYGGQVTYISHIEFPNIGYQYVQIDTNIVSLSRIQPMMNKGSQ